MQRRDLLKSLAIAPIAAHTPGCATVARKLATTLPLDSATRYASKWQHYRDMAWTGEDTWAQRLQDFAVRDGRLHCLFSGPDRSVHVLTHQLDAQDQPFRARVRIGFAGAASASADNDLAGFRLGVQGPSADYRSAAIHGGTGIDIGLTRAGQLRIGDAASTTRIDEKHLAQGIELRLEVAPKAGASTATLRALDHSGRVLAEVASSRHAGPDWAGNIALLSHFKQHDTATPSAWFDGLVVEGERLRHHPAQAFGAVYFAQYTLHRGVLKLSAQLAPIDAAGAQTELQLQRDVQWHTVQSVQAHPLARVAAFRIEAWDAGQAMPYCVRHAMPLREGGVHEYFYEGTIAAEPRKQDVLRALTLSCNWDVGFPDNDVVAHASAHKADLAMFLGDQFYEPNGGFSVQMSPLPQAVLDYLRKWIQFGWSYRELFRHIPSLCLLDDHDMFHGNIWGSGGRATIPEGGGAAMQDSGGYKLPAQWVNMAQLTQASHMPDPYDPRPVQQGIEVYYTHWEYAGLSLGIVEDRKFKSAPQDILPPEAEVFNGYAQNPGYDRNRSKWLEAQLLGERQLEFLSRWSHDWNETTRFKALVSATTFGCLQTLPAGSRDDQGTPGLPLPAPGEYVQGDLPTRDMDSNGWPQNRRDEVLRLLRRNVIVHLAGDQHLPAVVQYGVDAYRDSTFAFACPALGNIWPRRWWPPLAADHQPIPGQPPHTGDFIDGFGNKLTVYAVANPRRTGLEPALLHDRVTGYGVVDFDMRHDTVTLHCWPRHVDPTVQPDGEFAGWPVTIDKAGHYRPRDARTTT